MTPHPPPDTTATDLTAITAAIRTTGFVFLPASMAALQFGGKAALADWPAFAASWGDLAVDTYMADGGRYRRRRHAVFSADHRGTIAREPHQPHYQGLEYNGLNGGIERWFEPVEAAIGTGASLHRIMATCLTAFQSLAPVVARWKIEVHQFRIDAVAGVEGKPTPEGMHRDGVDYVLVLMIRRTNITSGTTTLADAAKQPIGTFTLTEPLDAVLLDDQRVYHGVTPVAPVDPGAPAYRDVLVVTFKAVR